MTIAITGATGQLGQLVIQELLKRTAPTNIVAIVRDASRANDIAAQGIEVRQANYNDIESINHALVGIERLLLISSSEVGQRLQQHSNVIAAARKTDVKHVIYTSLLHADRSTLGLAQEHLDTERTLQRSGLFYTILRNGWYTENYTGSLKAAVDQAMIIGAAGNGKISSAARQDYAEAAAVVLTTPAHENKIYELAGDQGYTLTELAKEVSQQTGKNIVYLNLTEHDYREKLLNLGIDPALANIITDSDARAAQGALFDDQGDLHRLLNRNTTPLSDVVAKALA